jgi:IS5 family transposase
MSHRLIGQERLKVDPTSRSGATLERLSSLIDWQPVTALLAPLYPSAKGEPAWPPLAMFKALLLAVWHDLSDVKLAEALEDRASFRRFCGFAAHEPTPERSAFVRFRRALIAHGLDRLLFEAVTGQLKRRAITIKTGTLVDATIIASASKDDDEARWVKHRGRGAVHGFKAHVGADANTALVEAVSVTPANVNDGREGPAVLPEDPGDVFADSAYRGQHFEGAVRARGGVPRVAATAMWGRDEAETLARLAAWNGAIQRMRARVEKIFGTWKRCYGLRRMRWRGLARAAAQVHFTATAYNLKRSLNLQPA